MIDIKWCHQIKHLCPKCPIFVLLKKWPARFPLRFKHIVDINLLLFLKISALSLILPAYFSIFAADMLPIFFFVLHSSSLPLFSPIQTHARTIQLTKVLKLFSISPIERSQLEKSGKNNRPPSTYVRTYVLLACQEYWKCVPRNSWSENQTRILISEVKKRTRRKERGGKEEGDLAPGIIPTKLVGRGRLKGRNYLLEMTAY